MLKDRQECLLFKICDGAGEILVVGGWSILFELRIMVRLLSLFRIQYTALSKNELARTIKATSVNTDNLVVISCKSCKFSLFLILTYCTLINIVCSLLYIVQCTMYIACLMLYIKQTKAYRL